MSDYHVDSSGLLMNLNRNFDEVQTFIEKLKNQEFLLKGCSIFVQVEPRDAVYVSALRSIESGEQSTKRKAEAAKTLLLSWNEVYYKDRPMLVERIVPDIQEFLRVSEKQMDTLKNAKLGRIIPGEALIVTELFKRLSAVESIEKTGAAKALNLLIPEVFVMWDTCIREAYHDLYHVHNKEDHKNGDTSCYASFMRKHNEIASALLPTEEELKTKHPVFARLGIRRSIAKMLDEANYARFTKKLTW